MFRLNTMNNLTTAQETEYIEMRLLLEAVFSKYGYDFRNYSEASIRRRVKLTLPQFGLENMAELIHEMLADRIVFETLLLNFSITVTEMFRDPAAYLSIRRQVLPDLHKYPNLKIWHAGCSTGEEVYSMAILLKEEGLYNKTQIFATDFNEIALKKAKDGIYPSEQFSEYTRNYQKSGGKEPFTNYYTTNYDFSKISDVLKDNILFSDHNLVTDGSFGEMNLIICRNVFIYFNWELQNRVLKLFVDSLCPRCYLWLGKKETVRLSKLRGQFEVISGDEKIYRKID